MTNLDKQRDELAERHAWDQGTPHGNREEPAWHYSIIDFKAGFSACEKILSERIEKLEADNSELRKEVYRQSSVIEKLGSGEHE